MVLGERPYCSIWANALDAVSVTTKGGMTVEFLITFWVLPLPMVDRYN
jgi:hypothetical protein